MMGMLEYDGVWMPQLIEILKYAKDDPEYWGKFGFAALEVPADCPTVAASMPYMTERFNRKYRFRMIGAETMEVWQSYLQNIFDDNVHRLERALRLYADNDAVMKIVNGTTETFHQSTDDVATDKDTGSITSEAHNTRDSENTETSADTPDTLINTLGDYASKVTKDKGKVQDNGGNTTNTTGDKLTTKQGIRDYDILRRDNRMNVDSVNNAVERWMDLQCSFVDRFENCFMNIFR